MTSPREHYEHSPLYLSEQHIGLLNNIKLVFETWLLFYYKGYSLKTARQTQQTYGIRQVLVIRWPWSQEVTLSPYFVSVPLVLAISIKMGRRNEGLCPPAAPPPSILEHLRLDKLITVKTLKRQPGPHLFLLYLTKRILPDSEIFVLS